MKKINLSIGLYAMLASFILTGCQLVHETAPSPLVQVPLLPSPPPQLRFETQNFQPVYNDLPVPLEEINPLTDYIEEYQDDPAMQSYVARVIRKRDAKCKLVERHYRSLPQEQVWLEKLAEYYSYSCPHIVAQFIDAFERKNSR